MHALHPPIQPAKIFTHFIPHHPTPLILSLVPSSATPRGVAARWGRRWGKGDDVHPFLRGFEKRRPPNTGDLGVKASPRVASRKGRYSKARFRGGLPAGSTCGDERQVRSTNRRMRGATSVILNLLNEAFFAPRPSPYGRSETMTDNSGRSKAAERFGASAPARRPGAPPSTLPKRPKSLYTARVNCRILPASPPAFVGGTG